MYNNRRNPPSRRQPPGGRARRVMARRSGEPRSRASPRGWDARQDGCKIVDRFHTPRMKAMDALEQHHNKGKRP